MLEGERKRQTDKLIEMKRERGGDREVEREEHEEQEGEERNRDT